jgi:hypothetical protein
VKRTVLDDYGNWLAGFIDGEGCFQIAQRGNQSKTWYCSFTIKLRDDDTELLEEAQRLTDWGHVRRYDGPSFSNPQSVWVITAKEECWALVEFLRAYPLRSRKRNDLFVWEKAVKLWITQRHWSKHRGSAAFREDMLRFQQELREGRSYAKS